LWHLHIVDKILFSLVDVKFDDFFQYSTVVTTQGHPFKLFKSTVMLMPENHFSQHSINVWNNLPPGIVDFSSLKSFKKTIKLVDFSSVHKCF